MKYMDIKLKDGTEVKFKLKRYGLSYLYIFWKYKNEFKLFPYKIQLEVYTIKHLENMVHELERVSDEELIAKYICTIEREHNELKSIKRKI